MSKSASKKRAQDDRAHTLNLRKRLKSAHVSFGVIIWHTSGALYDGMCGMIDVLTNMFSGDPCGGAQAVECTERDNKAADSVSSEHVLLSAGRM